MKLNILEDNQISFEQLISKVPAKDIVDIRAAIIKLTNFAMTYEQLSLEIYNGQLTTPAIFYRIKKIQIKYPSVIKSCIDTSGINVKQILERLNEIATSESSSPRDAVKSGAFLLNTIFKVNEKPPSSEEVKQPSFLKEFVDSTRFL